MSESESDDDKDNSGIEFNGRWEYIPEPILLQIFQYLSVKDLLNAGLTCKNWLAISYDDYLWRDIVYSTFQIDRSIKMPPRKHFWRQEYKRLNYHIPLIQTETFNDHKDQVLHVTFSNDGKLFATCSKDGFVMVLDAGYPATIKYSENMKKHSWLSTHFCQFNQSDTYLLVSGVDFYTHSQEIAVFSLQDGFKYQYAIKKQNCDIIGTWFSDHHLIYGSLNPVSPLAMESEFFLSKACQRTDFKQSDFTKLCKVAIFNRNNISSIMIANCFSSSKESISERRENTENLLEECNTCKTESWSSSLNIKKNTDSQLDVSLNPSSSKPEYYYSKKKCFKDLSEFNVEKLLIYLSSFKTYTPHQLGFYKIRPSMLLKTWDHDSNATEIFLEEMNKNNSEPDHLIDLEGHIIGMGLSPDHRYLYVNSRPWPQYYEINDPLVPPPIAQEIDIHVIDLVTFEEVGTILHAHKAYTPNNECIFIALNVSKKYVASGAEDKHGYLWDRNYGICLAKYPHTNVVTSIAFNPRDSEMLVTTSSDCSIKIWRSRNKVKELKIENESALPRGIEMRLRPKKRKRF